MDEDMAEFLVSISGGKLTIEQARQQIAAAGGGNTVYLGITKGKTSTTTNPRPGGPPIVVKTSDSVNTVTVQEAYLKFWKEPATKSKMLAQLAKMGRSNLGELGAYELWKDTVDSSAEIYAGGKGYNITPFELLNLSARKAAPEPQLPQRYVEKLNPATVNDLVDSIYLDNIGKLASAAEKEYWYKEFDKMNTGTVSTTKKVKNSKGVLENVTTRETGFSQDTATAKLEAKLKKDNPLEYERRKAFEFVAEINKLNAGGM